MRAFLMYMLFLLPMIAAGQGIRCDVDRRFNLSREDDAYNAFLKRISHDEVNDHVTSRTQTYFPVVIHVVLRDGYQPVSLAQATQQMDVLNADFAGSGDNIGGLSDEFIPLVADVGMHFCLATVDPDGNPTSGITYTRTEIKDIALQTGPGGRMAIHYDQLGGKTGWDPARYINIWVGEYGSFLGSASFPGMASYPEEIGVIIDPQYFGSIGDAGQSGFYARGHTLTHEMGHFFGLKHIWGSGLDANCDDSDEIEDTPNAAGPYYDCPPGMQESCGTSDMYRNFMDFTDDRCLAAFTQGQAVMMRSVRDVYYPGLAVEGRCTGYSASFSDWYARLVWSHDQAADRYVIYNTNQWMGPKEILLYSVDGKIILEDDWNDEFSYLLDLGNVASGVYFLRIADGDSQYVRKIIAY